ncbi:MULTISPECIES: hypothetical protein [Glutamicibacter]|uniref:hypothetical protein n=1 Tax=Glutamicibacter TaxID=1742989 RepID=UPI00167F6E29|nr:hypothetical protein [Glutamicibacter nicotianae]
MSLSSPVAVVAADDGVVSAPSIPDGPTRRRSFSPGQKLQYLSEYEVACETGEGAGYLRRHGLYSSLISEWRLTRGQESFTWFLPPHLFNAADTPGQLYARLAAANGKWGYCYVAAFCATL